MEDSSRPSDAINDDGLFCDSSLSKSRRKNFSCLFPYDNANNKYELTNDLSELDESSAQYVRETIEKFNTDLKGKSSYISIFNHIGYSLLYFLCFVIFIAILYVSILLCALCLFNPMLIIAILFFILTNVMALIFKIHCKIVDSKKSKKIKGMIDAENTLQKGNNNKRVWGIGREGTWIEVKFPFKQF